MQDPSGSGAICGTHVTPLVAAMQPFAVVKLLEATKWGVVRRVRFQLDGTDPLLLLLYSNLIGTKSLHCKKCSLVRTTGFLVCLAHSMRANAFSVQHSDDHEILVFEKA
jgi:hypothetical protein